MPNFLVILPLLFFSLATSATEPTFKSVKKFRDLSVGSDSNRKVSEVITSLQDKIVGNNAEKFSIFYYNKALKLICYNLNCGDWAKTVVDHGGNIEAGSDWKFGRSLSLSPVMGKKGWESPSERVAKVVINGKVHGIYTNVDPSDIVKIVDLLIREKIIY